MGIPFDKYSGCGNDFIVIDNRKETVKPLIAEQVVRLCKRKRGVGADGLIFVKDSQIADIKMSIFNADGTEAEMCGNGIRCLVDYCCRRAICPHSCTVETLGGILQAEWNKGEVKVQMPPPHSLKREVSIDNECSLTFINTGVPHAIAFVEELENFPLETFGAKVRYHESFKPAGTNFSIAKTLKPQKLLLRTYERGVEKETESCGTAATAAALAAHIEHNFASPISVQTPNGYELVITFSPKFEKVTMTGPTSLIYSGHLSEFLLY